MGRSREQIFETAVEVDGEEIGVEVAYVYSPATPDVMYLSNGDPGYPGSDAEAEVLAVWKKGDATKTDLMPKMTPEAIESLFEQACTEGEEDDGGYEEAMEARYERDREDPPSWED
jgi:hypothetical protein